MSLSRRHLLGLGGVATAAGLFGLGACSRAAPAAAESTDDVTAEAEANSPIADQVEGADDAQVDAVEETAEAVSEDATHAEGSDADKA